MKKFFFVVWNIESGYEIVTLDLNKGEQVQNFPRSLHAVPFINELSAYKFALDHSNILVRVIRSTR